MSKRLSKICHWSSNLFKTIQTNAVPDIQNWNNSAMIRQWLDTVEDKDMGANIRLFVHQFVPVPEKIFNVEHRQQER